MAALKRVDSTSDDWSTAARPPPPRLEGRWSDVVVEEESVAHGGIDATTLLSAEADTAPLQDTGAPGSPCAFRAAHVESGDMTPPNMDFEEAAGDAAAAEKSVARRVPLPYGDVSVDVKAAAGDAAAAVADDASPKRTTTAKPGDKRVNVTTPGDLFALFDKNPKQGEPGHHYVQGACTVLHAGDATWEIGFRQRSGCYIMWLKETPREATAATTGGRSFAMDGPEVPAAVAAAHRAGVHPDVVVHEMWLHLTRDGTPPARLELRPGKGDGRQPVWHVQPAGAGATNAYLVVTIAKGTKPTA